MNENPIKLGKSEVRKTIDALMDEARNEEQDVYEKYKAKGFCWGDFHKSAEYYDEVKKIGEKYNELCRQVLIDNDYTSV